MAPSERLSTSCDTTNLHRSQWDNNSQSSQDSSLPALVPRHGKQHGNMQALTPLQWTGPTPVIIKGYAGRGRRTRTSSTSVGWAGDLLHFTVGILGGLGSRSMTGAKAMG